MYTGSQVSHRAKWWDTQIGTFLKLSKCIYTHNYQLKSWYLLVLCGFQYYWRILKTLCVLTSQNWASSDVMLKWRHCLEPGTCNNKLLLKIVGYLCLLLAFLVETKEMQFERIKKYIYKKNSEIKKNIKKKNSYKKANVFLFLNSFELHLIF